jgi:hypothetical protein
MPGETLKSASIQARVFSDPLVSNIQGWWLEFYLFYVRVGDFLTPFNDSMRNTLRDPTNNPSSTQADTPSWAWYHGPSTEPNFMYQCYGPIVRAYFRKEGEDGTTAILDRYCATRVTGSSGLVNSLYTDASIGSPTGADGWAQNWNAFQQIMETRITSATWEEFLAQQGVSTPPKLVEYERDFQIPELVRFVRDFAYPLATVNQSDGTIKTTVQWSMTERVDKKRFFAEPGFLVGLMCCRPKCYFLNQNGSLSDCYLGHGAYWPRPEWDTDPHMRLLKWAPGAAGPVRGGSVAYWHDMADLFLYGDQFINQDPTAPISGTGLGLTTVALPATDLAGKEYPSKVDAQKVFVDGGTGGTAQWLHADGMCSIRIASKIGSDTTN